MRLNNKSRKLKDEEDCHTRCQCPDRPCKTDLFSHCLALQYEFTTTDIILDELYSEQIELIQPHIRSGKFVVIRISGEELAQIQSMSKEDARLSEQDWSAFYYAKQKDAVLLTGDRRLRAFAESKGITTRGIFWVLDELVETNLLAKAEACSFIKSLIANNKRLPVGECEQRMNWWCKK